MAFTIFLRVGRKIHECVEATVQIPEPIQQTTVVNEFFETTSNELNENLDVERAGETEEGRRHSDCAAEYSTGIGIVVLVFVKYGMEVVSNVFSYTGRRRLVAIGFTIPCPTLTYPTLPYKSINDLCGRLH
jgi:hypothetical protein